MMMKRSDFENFFPISKFFTCKLDYNRQSFKYKQSSNYKQDKNSICKHSHYSQICSEGQASDISHIKLSWFYIEPQKSYNCSDYCDTKC